MNHIKTCVYILITAMILSLVLTYASIMTIIQTTKDNTERVLDSFVTQNTEYIYNSLKNGNDFTSSIDADYFVSQFSSDRTLDFDGTYLYNRDSEGGYKYKLTVPNTVFTVDNTLNLTCTYDLLIPLDFAGNQFTEINIPIKVQTSYNLKEQE